MAVVFVVYEVYSARFVRGDVLWLGCWSSSRCFVRAGSPFYTEDAVAVKRACAKSAVTKANGAATKASMTVKSTLGLCVYSKLVLLCDGSGHEDACSAVHEGYTIEAPGATLKKLAPVLLVAHKALSVMSVVGKVAGLPIPDGIPGVEALKGIASGKASVVTDEIERFTETGVRLKSGKALDADIIITATGLSAH